MSERAIVVERIAKRYRIGVRAPSGGGVAGRIVHALTAPWRRVQAIRGNASGPNGRFWALKDVSFEVMPGEVVGIIGRNGAGKSTLLKILARITEPTRGRAVIRGRLASLLEVGTGFHRELTGRENIYLSGAMLGMRKAEIDRSFDNIVGFAEIGEFIDTPVKWYSSGMYVRLAFAVAAHLQPEILLVDEVLAVGDIQFQRRCLGKMNDVARSGRTVLFVSHNLAAVQSLCSRAMLIQGGRLATIGPVQQTIKAYIESVAELAQGQSLADRQDRIGDGRLRFTKVEFLDGQTMMPLDIIMTGQPVRIRAHYHCHAPNPLDDVVISIAFQTMEGTHLFGCDTDAIGRVVRIEPGAGSIVCDLPKWPLNRGRIAYDVAAYQCRRELDYVRDAGIITVEKGDFYGTGKLPVFTHQGVYVDYDYPCSDEPVAVSAADAERAG